jgi:hypothetical protein
VYFDRRDISVLYLFMDVVNDLKDRTKILG